MSILDELTRLNSAKSDIETAIYNKGVTVPAGTKLDGMAILIGNISTGTDTSDATLNSGGQLLSGVTAYSNGVKYTGTIQSKAAATYTPTTSDQTIAAGQYLSGAQTVKGDANLVAANIKKDVTIFGITGTHEGGGGSVTPPETPTDAVIFYSPKEFTLRTYNRKKNWNGTLYYSTDHSNWNTWAGTDALTAVKSDGYYKLYLRGTGNTYLTTGASSSNARWVFVGSGIMCCGNLNKLLSYSGTPTLAEYAFANLFYNAVNVDFDVELPATTLTNSCYYYMFYGCASLTTAPALPATTLTNYCYNSMFQNCTSLTAAPALPATTLANSCYNSMFSNCASLTTAPALPVTTLAERCYYYMFNGCASLTTAPALPATTLANSCYNSMFNGCASLTTAPALPATTLTNYCYYSMFYNCKLIKMSTSRTGAYQTAYRIPTSGTGTTATSALSSMFGNTGGTFTGTPTINTTYYTSNTVVS